jgi:hypothetical protein
MGTPIPQSTYDRAELLARSHPLGTVAEIMGVHRSTVSKMKARAWRAVDYKHTRRPIPSTWGLYAPDLTVNQLAAHYRTPPRTICRWMRERPVRARMKPGPRSEALKG